jgi:diketogulonate reductase-like aldo/keto reductase
MLAACPPLVYGTAWKEGATSSLVLQALAAGFRGIDTAAQRKHYREHAVGEALLAAERARLVRRDEVWVQTK